MIDQDEITRRLDQLEVARAQDFQVMSSRLDSVEADIIALEKRQEYRFVELERRMERMENMLKLLLTHTQKLLKRLEE